MEPESLKKQPKNESKETNGIDSYLKKHIGGVHMTHSKTLDENDEIIREANKAVLEEGAAEANKNAAW